MKQKNKKLLSIILALCIALSCVVGMSATASAEETDTSTYSLVIPSTLNVQNSGWNDVGEISATGTLAQGKKLTVSAQSANSFALVSGENSVAYTMKSAEADTEATTAWEFTELPGSAAFGIDVADYSTKPAGTYQDTVTFTAKVEDAAPATITVTWNNDDITGTWGETFTKDGVTITADMIDFHDTNFMGGGTFSTTLGNFTKIEVSCGYCGASGTGWSGNSKTKTWTGNASSVSFSGDFMGMGMGNTKLVFTIEPTN